MKRGKPKTVMCEVLMNYVKHTRKAVVTFSGYHNNNKYFHYSVVLSRRQAKEVIQEFQLKKENITVIE